MDVTYTTPVTSHVDNSDGTTAITCPVCSKQKRISVAKLKHKKHVLKVRCSCKTVFLVLLNYRNHYRKSVSLSGAYRTYRQYYKCKGLAQITNISISGLQYRVVGLNRLIPGSFIDLDFQLDDKHQSPIKKRALVRYSHKNVVGCEFLPKGDIDRVLSSYLFL
jgi:hypothetical protein